MAARAVEETTTNAAPLLLEEMMTAEAMAAASDGRGKRQRGAVWATVVVEVATVEARGSGMSGEGIRVGEGATSPVLPWASPWAPPWPRAPPWAQRWAQPWPWAPPWAPEPERGPRQ